MPKRVIFHELKTPEEALAVISGFIKRSEVEYVNLEDSYMRVLAEDVYAKVDVPPFDRATMDGYALRAEDTFGADELHPVKLRLSNLSINAGDSNLPLVEKGSAVEIATGAPLPPGSNAVVPVEYTKVDDGTLTIYRSVTPMDNVMSAGSDIMMGELILRRCTLIKEREVGVLAAVGIDKVPVFKRPRVAIISSGNELVKPGSLLSMGKIYDINTYTIAHGVREAGGEPLLMGIVKDDEAEMEGIIRDALSKADLVLLSGGTSAGALDISYRVLDRIGPPGVIVHGLNVKPGKPTVVAVSKEGKLVVGLPGYPSSALMIFNIIVKPILAKMQCLSLTQPVIRAQMAIRVEGARGRRGLNPVSLVETESGVKAYPLPAESGAITTLAYAEGYIEIPENREFLEEGEWVNVRLFTHQYKPANLYIMGSHDVALDSSLIPLLPDWITAKVINIGSLEGLKAAIRGEADVAGIHLIDEETGEYNEPFVRKYGEGKVRLVAGYMREQGIILPKGNPRGISSFEDLIRLKLRIVNRNKGAGTRFLFDKLLKEYALRNGVSFEELAKSIPGYYHEARTHTAVAAAIAQGRAEAGVGIRAAAEMYGLDFIPLAWERYDFAVPLSKLSKDSVRVFISVLKDEEFKRRLSSIPGYKTLSNTGEFII
ncbi:molybdopterin biosynthesis protein [Caldivirga maquilingensis]|uniref:Molybdenum cofactor synthesis domain n=1 Tax=Caldivirga maquilingensis (strain ATCC 700844 / DSM 13496 / JCM 10307 / IC-167) TaxID=397948 RepID=A8M9Q6_CALMQ|nr:molybdopterin biosynthesis protein [Caldivirga maquilingensis]ABW00937.1 molybdenum cofactor synthesis domain [Caldivirga maquilingensis IC-167]